MTAPTHSPAEVAALVAGIVRDVAELGDRTSPEDRPDMMLVTAEELTNIVTGALEAMLDPAHQEGGVASMPVAAAVQAEREACARWHEDRAKAAWSEPWSDFEKTKAVADHHEKSAAVIRARTTTDALADLLAQAREKGRREGIEAAAARIEDAEPALAEYIRALAGKEEGR